MEVKDAASSVATTKALVFIWAYVSNVYALAIVLSKRMIGVGRMCRSVPRCVEDYSPICIAMCAGRRGEVTIGDVIVADRLWMYDAGKLKVEYDASEAEGWTGLLIDAARAQNEGHAGLREVAEVLMAGRTK